MTKKQLSDLSHIGANLPNTNGDATFPTLSKMNLGRTAAVSLLTFMSRLPCNSVLQIDESLS